MGNDPYGCSSTTCSLASVQQGDFVAVKEERGEKVGCLHKK